MTSLLWLRQDLRLADQAALVAAAGDGAFLPVYVLDDETPGAWAIGAAQRWWLHHSLEALGKAFARHRVPLILRRGKAVDELIGLAREVNASKIHAIRHYEPWWVGVEKAVAREIDLCLHDGNQLAPPETIRTSDDGLYKIYTPFWCALERQMPPPEPLDVPSMTAVGKAPRSDRLESWKLLPDKPDWAGGFAKEWTPGEEGARERLDDFLADVPRYATRRDLPSQEGTSRLSPHLHMGEVSPATIWRHLARAEGGKFLKELAWRDFAANMLLVFPKLGDRSARDGFGGFPWRTGKAARADFRAWTKGRTGYPIVDAGMRQLWATGWMHNRVRMIAASFLVKHLLIDWRAGARWFWDTLVDADYANNSLNWQWVAGTGLDSNPFGRIMAPLVQSPKFDAGDYIREWVPELAHLPDDAIHDPHEAGAACGDYPAKLIGHREARERALAALAAMKG